MLGDLQMFFVILLKPTAMTATEALRDKVKGYIDKADVQMLKRVQSVIEQDLDTDWWDELPENIQEKLDRAIKDGGEVNGTPHEEILKKYSKWFKK
jgi:chromosome condensin MukBEF complex kleisin-like MukF subunit